MRARADITIDTARPCDVCGKAGNTTESGRCFACITKALQEVRPVKRTKGGTAHQDPLIPMSDEELRAAGKRLAKLLNEARLMEEDHATVRAEQKVERDKLRDQIDALAQTIREQGR